MNLKHDYDAADLEIELAKGLCHPLAVTDVVDAPIARGPVLVLFADRPKGQILAAVANIARNLIGERGT